jgi:putative oxidoreductase
MTMRKVLFPDGVGIRGSIGLLLLRLVVGAAFVIHGWPKIQNAFHWMDAMGGQGMPSVLQALAALAEVGGGIALIVGLLTPLAALGIAGTMSVAIGMVHLRAGHPFVAVGRPSYELAAVYLAAAILLLLVGPGRLSLDALLFGSPAGTGRSSSAPEHFPSMRSEAITK